MELKTETITFLIFIVIGVITGIIFDFFRALRKVKKYNVKIVCLQDIIFFLIVGLIISGALIYELESNLRIYLFLAILLGMIFYVGTLSISVLNIFVSLIKVSNKVFSFILLPIDMLKENFKWLKERILKKLCNFLSKIKKKCCNIFFYVISYTYSKKKVFFKRSNLKKR